MDGEAMNALIKRVDQSIGVKPRYEILPGGFHYMVVNNDGEVRHSPMPRNPVAAAAYNADAIYSFIKLQTNSGVYQVTYSRNGVTGHGPGGHTIHLNLPFSPAFKLLMKGAIALNQRDLYKHLRTTFAGMVDASLIGKIGKVDIKKAAETSGAIARGNVSLTKSMVATASGTTELPEVVTFNLPTIWESTLGTPVVITCDFDLDPQTEVFTLTPLPGVIEKAQHFHECYLETVLQGAAKDYGLEPNLICGNY